MNRIRIIIVLVIISSNLFAQWVTSPKGKYVSVDSLEITLAEIKKNSDLTYQITQVVFIPDTFILEMEGKIYVFINEHIGANTRVKGDYNEKYYFYISEWDLIQIQDSLLKFDISYLLFDKKSHSTTAKQYPAKNVMVKKEYIKGVKILTESKQKQMIKECFDFFWFFESMLK